MPPTSSATSPERSGGSRSLLGLGGWLALAAVQVGAAFSLREAESSDRELFYEYGTAIGSLAVYGILVALTFALASAYGNARLALGLRSFSRRWLWLAGGVAVAALVVAFALEPVLHAGEEQGLAPEEWRPSRVGAFVVNGIVVATLVPFAEELFFRGLGVRALAFLGAPAAIAGSALVFGFAHGILVALPPLVFFALGLAWIRWRSDSVWPAIVAHGAYNGIGVVGAFVATQS